MTRMNPCCKSQRRSLIQQVCALMSLFSGVSVGSSTLSGVVALSVVLSEVVGSLDSIGSVVERGFSMFSDNSIGSGVSFS